MTFSCLALSDTLDLVDRVVSLKVLLNFYPWQFPSIIYAGGFCAYWIIGGPPRLCTWACDLWIVPSPCIRVNPTLA